MYKLFQKLFVLLFMMHFSFFNAQHILPQELNEDFRVFGQWAGEQVDEAARLQRQQHLNNRQRYENQLNSPDESIREHARDQLQRMDRREQLAQDMQLNFANQVGQFAVNAYQGMMNNALERENADIRRQQAIGIAFAQAQARGQADREMLQDKLNWIKEPKNLATLAVGAAGITLGIYGVYHLTSLMAEYVRYLYRNPTLAQETSLLSLGQKLKTLFISAANVSKKVSDVILTPDLEVEIANVNEAIKQANSTDDYLPNILFYGPPGTGKTMLAVRLARESGMDYLIISASALDQYSIEEALIKLTELFEFAKKSGKKLMIVIDEAERLFCKRRPDMPEKTAKMLTHLLTYIGTETSDFMVVGLTNMPDLLDKAFLSRCDYRIEIKAPDQEQRYRIIQKYAQDYLFNAPKPTRKPKLFGRLFGVKKPVRINIQKDVLSDAKMREIARQTNGFVGRDLSKMIFEMRRRATITKNKTLTAQIIDQVVTRKITEINNEKQGFKDYLK